MPFWRLLLYSPSLMDSGHQLPNAKHSFDRERYGNHKNVHHVIQLKMPVYAFPHKKAKLYLSQPPEKTEDSLLQR